MINKLTSYSSQERKHVETINSELLEQPSLPQHVSIGFFYITVITTSVLYFSEVYCSLVNTANTYSLHFIRLKKTESY